MRSWNRPEVPRLSGSGRSPRLWDTASQAVVEALPTHGATLYVCGITPYDATHIGHAATYLAYDTLVRLWLDAGYHVTYVQNVTDVDDPLLERANATGVDWRDLAASQVELFRGDMESLSIIPPDSYVAVTEVTDAIAAAVQRLLDSGQAYTSGQDVYFDTGASGASSSWQFGEVSHLDRDTMLALSAERGGGPATIGKRDPLDPILWRGERPGEPSWPGGSLGHGRPGWHIECSVIAHEFLDLPLTVQGGGHDLIFPHHEFSAGHTAALTGHRLAELYVHAGLVAYQGEKMSKSLGNLVLVSHLVDAGVDPRAIRLALLAHHYREDWEWTDAVLAAARRRLDRWLEMPRGDVTEALRAILSNDLDTPGALAYIDSAGVVDERAISALLGIDLR